MSESLKQTKFKLFRPFLIALALFLLVEVLLSLPLVESKLQAKVENWLQWKLEDIVEDNPQHEDVLAFGSSRTLHGFNAQRFETLSQKQLNAYNYGISFGDYYLFQLMLERHVKHYGKPDTVLLEISDFLLKEGSMPADNIVYFQTLLKDDPALFPKVMEAPVLSQSNKWEITFASLSSIYRYRDLLSPQKVIQTFWSTPNTRALQQGWKPHKNSNKSHTQKELQEHATQRVYRILGDYKKLDTQKLLGFIQYCQQNNIQVVLVAWPNHQSYQRQFAQYPIIKTFQQAVQNIQHDQNIRFIDLGNLPGTDKAENFADSDHLAEEGAIYYTEVLARALFK